MKGERMKKGKEEEGEREQKRESVIGGTCSWR